jgi:hypothetical protein
MDKPHHEFDDLEDNYSQRMKEQEAAKAVIEGVGQDAEIVTNSRGGKQSKAPMAMHLIDPLYLEDWADNLAQELEFEDEGESTTVDEKDVDKHNCYCAIKWIAMHMNLNELDYLQWAADCLCGDELQKLMRIAKVLQYGASRYAPNNWRLIPQEEHINHALIHIIAHLAGDTQDEHLDHALCRLMMAYATEKSDDFDYGSFVDTNKRG